MDDLENRRTPKVQVGDSTFQSNYNLWGPGDLIFDYDPSLPELDHVLIVVGWSIDIPNYSPSPSNPAPPIFPTHTEASEYFSDPDECQKRWHRPCDLILWGVEHGGSHPQLYARPINQMGTDITAYIIDMGS